MTLCPLLVLLSTYSTSQGPPHSDRSSAALSCEIAMLLSVCCNTTCNTSLFLGWSFSGNESGQRDPGSLARSFLGDGIPLETACVVGSHGHVVRWQMRLKAMVGVGDCLRLPTLGPCAGR